MSSIDLMPADTTAIGVLPSSVRSALTSMAERRQQINLITIFSKSEKLQVNLVNLAL